MFGATKTCTAIMKEGEDTFYDLVQFLGEESGFGLAAEAAELFSFGISNFGVVEWSLLERGCIFGESYTLQHCAQWR